MFNNSNWTFILLDINGGLIPALRALKAREALRL
jgi:hypothetical protein